MVKESNKRECDMGGETRIEGGSSRGLASAIDVSGMKEIGCKCSERDRRERDAGLLRHR